MHNSNKFKNPHPQTDASHLSIIFFWWMKDIFYNRYKDQEDLHEVLPSDTSEHLGNQLESKWLDQVMQTESGRTIEPNLWKAVIATFVMEFLLPGILMFFYNVFFKAIQSIYLARLIRFFCYNSTGDINEAFLNALGVSVTAFIIILLFNHCIYLCSTLGKRIRIAACSLIYRKVIHLSNTSAEQTDIGHVLNLISNDAIGFENYPFCIQFLWIAPIQTIVFTVIIWMYIGPAALVGLFAVLIQVLPIQVLYKRMLSKYQEKVVEKTDARVKLIREIVSGIGLIKMHAWEKPFEKIVGVARSVEVSALTTNLYLNTIYMTFRLFSEKMSLFVTLVTCILLGYEITPDMVFVIAHLFNTLHITLCFGVPLSLKYLSETLKTINKFQSFILLEENRIRVPVNLSSTNLGVTLDKVSVPMTPDFSKHTLNDVTLRVPKGQLCVIIGPLGAGKSTLLKVILGDIIPSSGTVTVGGEMSYASQEPWLFTGSVRQNILFGSQYDAKRYHEVLEVCGLEQDLYWFPNKDKFIVGDTSVCLSAGHYALINLARAVYNKADIYLLDEPLLSVNPQLSKNVFENCIKTFLSNKTRILITDQLQSLEFADLIIILKDGCIQHKGTFKELQSWDIDLATFSKDNNLIDEPQEIVKAKKSSVEKVQRLLAKVSVASIILPHEQKNVEVIVRHRMKNSIFFKYWYAGSCTFVLLLMMVVFVAGQIAVTCSDYWVSIWANHEELKHYGFHHNTTLPKVSRNIPQHQNIGEIFHSSTYIQMYCICVGITTVLLILRSLFFAKLCMRASKELHNIMFGNIMRATMKFFSTNPAESIVRRFSKDMSVLDGQIPLQLFECCQVLMVIAGSAILVLVVNYLLTALVILMAIVFYKSRRTYLSTINNLLNLEAITKTPMLSHISASFSGLPTIRASGAQEVLSKEFDILQDAYTSACQLTTCTNTFFILIMGIMIVILTIGVTFSFLLYDSGVSGGDVGLAITQVMALAEITNYGIYLIDIVNRRLKSVEKLLQYIFVTPESDLEFSSVAIPSENWPTRGAIEFRNVTMQFIQHGPVALNDINLIIQPGNKIGIVGPTAAGKSSVITTLFRLAPFEGSLLIDGVNTETLDLHTLRRKLSIIPTYPVVFSGSLRENLDPLGEFTDMTLWHALEKVELDHVVSTLDFTVSEGGMNLTFGQRQLVCLARAIVRNNKILVLDESTTNIDSYTNKIMQKTIRKHFQDCTVLAVEQKLQTIIDFDEIIVMEDGQILEQNHPHVLLQDNTSLFYLLVKSKGKAMAAKLTDMALNAYKRKKSTS